MRCFHFLPSPRSAGTDTTWYQRDAGTLAGSETSSITSEVTVEFDWSIMASACKRESSFACTSRISTSWNHLRYTCLRNPRVPAKQLDECSTLRGIYTTTLGRDPCSTRSVRSVMTSGSGMVAYLLQRTVNLTQRMQTQKHGLNRITIRDWVGERIRTGRLRSERGVGENIGFQ